MPLCQELTYNYLERFIICWDKIGSMESLKDFIDELISLFLWLNTVTIET